MIGVSPDQRRYYNIICIASGADPVRFIPLAVKDGVPESPFSRNSARGIQKEAGGMEHDYRAALRKRV